MVMHVESQLHKKKANSISYTYDCKIQFLTAIVNMYMTSKECWT